MTAGNLEAGYSARQIREAEEPLLAAGVPLMRRAAQGLADQIVELLPEGRPGRVLLLVGPGNNGGDALYAAVHLAEAGHAVDVLPVSDRIHEAGLAAALEAGAELVAEGRRTPDAGVLAASADIVVDGILGTGTSGHPALRGLARDIVAIVRDVLEERETRPRVVAVDLPSGIHPDDGSVPDELVLRADLTVTFGACKAGLLLQPAAGLAGRVVVVDIGLGPRLAGTSPLVDAPRPVADFP